MKTSLKFTALVLAASFPGVAFAEILGVTVPTMFAVENLAVAFSLLLISLIMVSDYSSQPRALRPRRFHATTQPHRETHRLAA